MSKLTLKLACLLSLAITSSISWASTPWAEEEAQVEAEAPVETFEDSSPAMLENEAAVAEPAVEEEAAVEEEPATVEVTEQQGDVLAMPTVAQPIGVRLLDFPRRGMTTSKVENELGRPTEIIPAVGEPPIARWVYDDRIVFFEYSSVIHVVAK